jgi:hypothetical protein
MVTAIWDDMRAYPYRVTSRQKVTGPASVTFWPDADSVRVEVNMNTRLSTPFRALHVALGLTATLAGLDKFFNILADWGSYVSPLAASLLPFEVATLMGIVGIVEIAVGVAILAAAPRLGAYVASAWLLLVAANLAIGGHFDVAVRDVVMSIAAFVLAREIELRSTVAAGAPIRRTVTA